MKTLHLIPLILTALALLALGPTGAPAQQPLVVPDGRAYTGKKLTAKVFNSGFPEGHDTYNGMGVASDGRVYYVLSSERPDVAGQMYFYDPYTDRTVHVGDLT